MFYVIFQRNLAAVLEAEQLNPCNYADEKNGSKEKIIFLCSYQGPSQGFGKISIPQQYRTACTERKVRLVDDNECSAHTIARLGDARCDTCCVLFIRFFFTGPSSGAIYHP